MKQVFKLLFRVMASAKFRLDDARKRRAITNKLCAASSDPKALRRAIRDTKRRQRKYMRAIENGNLPLGG